MRSVDFGSWFNDKEDERALFLKDVLDTISNRLDLYIEIVDKITAIIFDYEIVSKLKRILPTIKMIYIVYAAVI